MKRVRTGLACVSILKPVITKGGRSARTSDVRFSTEWIAEGPNASAEERATLCDLRIFVNEENACLHFDPDSRKTFDHVTVPAVHLAEGLATDWWSIFGGRDRQHPILHYRTGFALPNLSFKFDGSTFEVTGAQLSSENPNLRFWLAGTEPLSRDSAESTLSNFIERVVDKLACSGVTDSEAAVCWSHVSASRKDPDERAFCEAAGALGVDPYLISDADAQFIEDAGNLFSGEPLIEFLAGIKVRPRADALQFLAWVGLSGDRSSEESRLPDLPDIARQIGDSTKSKDGERSWAIGYRAARALRAAIVREPGRAIHFHRGHRKEAWGRRLHAHPGHSRGSGSRGSRRRRGSRPSASSWIRRVGTASTELRFRAGDRGCGVLPGYSPIRGERSARCGTSSRRSSFCGGTPGAGRERPRNGRQWSRRLRDRRFVQCLAPGSGSSD